MPEMNNKRNDDIDFLKAVAIALVVIGHTIQYVVAGDFDDSIVFRYIYSFHMPLFMFISGWLSFSLFRENDFRWLKQRFYHLVIPFAVWTLLSYLIGRMWTTTPLLTWIWEILKRPDNGLWFLWVLFLNSGFLHIAVTLSRMIAKRRDDPDGFIAFIRKTIVMGAVAFVVLALGMFVTGYFGLGLCSWHIVFFFAGHWVSEYTKRFCKKRISATAMGVLKTFLILAFLGFAYFWKRTSMPVFLEALNGLHTHTLYRWAIQILYLIYKYCVAFLGIGAIWSISTMVAPKVKGGFAFISKYTMEIYVLQMFFLKNFTNILSVNIALSILLGITVPIIVGKIVEKSNLLGLLLFGKGRFRLPRMKTEQ